MPNEVKSHIVTDVGHFLEKIESRFGTVLFRGQAVKGKLLPGIARDPSSGFTLLNEKQKLHQLRLLGALLPEVKGADQLDLLVAAQHHGMKTRLLDWSSNSLVALWFACSDRLPGAAYVYMLESFWVDVARQGDHESLKDLLPEGQIEPSKTFVLQPSNSNRRVLAQSGWFTYHHFNAEKKCFVPLEEDELMNFHITEFMIPAELRGKFMKSLSLTGIDRRTLFPDMDGLCRYLNESEL